MSCFDDLQIKCFYVHAFIPLARARSIVLLTDWSQLVER